MSVPTAAAEFAQEIWAADDFVAKARERVEHSLDKPDSGLDKSKIRSIYWKVFLGCVDRKDKSIWKNQVEAQRNEYQEYLKDMTADPASKKDMDLDLNNPLSQGNDNPWTQYYENMELCKVIQLDLDRTHPGSAFFQDKKIQKQMLNILFVWSKMNPDYSYRQGMNELLSPILLTLSNDADKAANESPPNSSGESGEVFRLLMSKKFIEHDSFVVFNKLMSHMRQYFAVVKPTSPQRQSRLVSKPFVPQQTPIVTKCENLQQKILKSVDKVLHRHLEDEDVQPTLYLLRWVRLLFAREFHILDVQLIWDHVFALATYSPRKELELPLMDYFCVAMCLYVRADLLRGDNSTCLRRLLSFPPVGQMATLVQRAVQLMRGKHLRSVKPAAPRSTKGGKAAIRGIRGGQTPTKRAVDQRFTGKGIAASVGGNVRNILNYVPSIGAAVAGGSGGKDQAREAEVKALKTRMAEMEKKMLQVAKMGEIVQNIVNTLESQFGAGKTQNVSVILRSLAELKSVKDVLIGRINAENVLEYLMPKDEMISEGKESSPESYDPLGDVVEKKKADDTKVASNHTETEGSSPLPNDLEPAESQGSPSPLLSPKFDSTLKQTHGGPEIPSWVPKAQSSESGENSKPTKAELAKKHQALLDDLLGDDLDPLSGGGDDDNDGGGLFNNAGPASNPFGDED